MEEIKKLLHENNIPYIDKGLSWGADLSAYSDELKNLTSGVAVYGIELSDNDNIAPDSYVRIDHHNDFSDRDAAIKQVADIIGVNLNRDQQLVAANDSGYIPAMQAMNATPEEITDIRRRDRAAQGVTEEEERMADEAIRETSTRSETSLSVSVPNELNHFSPITDAEFGTRHITVYNGNELCYYGPLAHSLGKEHAKDVEEGRMYFGGAEASGFFGTSSGKVSRIGIIQLEQEIVERIQKEEQILTDIKHTIVERKDLPEDVNLPEDVIRILATDEDNWVRKTIAEREDLPMDVIRNLATDEKNWIRKIIAKREDLPIDLVLALSSNEDSEVRVAIAERKNLPENVIRTLTEDEDWKVRCAVAERDDFPKDLIRSFVADKKEVVRLVIARREDLPEDVVRTLIKDGDYLIHRAIAEHKDLPEDVVRILASDEDQSARKAIAKRPDLPEDLIYTLAKDINWEVREAIAERPDLSEDFIRILAKDKFEEVRQAIANRKSLPEDVLRTLINDEDTYVRKLIVQREDLPKDIVRIPTPQEVLEQKVFDLLSTFPDKRLVFDRPLFVYSNPDPFDLYKMFANEIYIGTDYHCEKFTELHGKTTWGNELTSDDVAVRFINHRNQEKYDKMMEEIGWVTTGNDAIIAEEMGLDPYNQKWPDGVGSKLFSDEYSQKRYEYNREILAKTVLKRIYAEKAKIKYDAEEKKNSELAKIFEKEHTGYVDDKNVRELFLVMNENYCWISDMECHSMNLHHFKTLDEATKFFNEKLSEAIKTEHHITQKEGSFSNGLVYEGPGCSDMSLIKITRELTADLTKDWEEFYNISPYEEGYREHQETLKNKYKIGLPFTDKEMEEIRRSVLHEEPKKTNTFRERADYAVASGRLRSVGELHDGWALVQANNGKFNYTNDKGKFMTKNWFDSATEFSKGVAIIKRDGCTAKINNNGIAVEVVNNIAKRTGNSPKIG